MGGPPDSPLYLPSPVRHSDLISRSLGPQELPGSTECRKFTEEDQLWGHQHTWQCSCPTQLHSCTPLDFSAMYLACLWCSSKWDLTGTTKALTELPQVAGRMTVTSGLWQGKACGEDYFNTAFQYREGLTLPPV